MHKQKNLELMICWCKQKIPRLFYISIKPKRKNGEILNMKF